MVRSWVVMVVSLLGGCGPSVSDAGGSTTEGSGSGSSAGSGDPMTASSVGSSDDPGTTMPGTTVDATTSAEESGVADTSIFTQQWDVDRIITGCSIWERDCPAGMKCMPYANDGGSAWNDTICSSIADDPRDVGDPCTAWNESATSGVDDCDFHSMCWDVDPITFEGTCVAFCEGSPERPYCSDPATTCVQSSDGPLSLCFPRCHPIDDPCPRGASCLPANDAFQCVPEGGGSALGESCEFLNDCDAGLFCAPAVNVPGCASEACCAAFCATTAAEPCPGAPEGVVCVPWWREGEAPPGYEELGACVLP